ncbi:MAG: hypothetical protein BK997_03370 [Candidatus Micrarchaeum sp. ARMAN-1]|nr:MAG: hypothetical protein BK997_03370 [Candidatus Micrarchaeum sp. ARMAN-1]
MKSVLKEKKFLALAITLVVVAAGLALYFSSSAIPTSSAQSISPSIQARFAVLSKATSDQCAYLGNKEAIYNSVNSQPQGAYFQGSCCSPMNLNHYSQQIVGLKNYSNISAIPQDPYNVSVAQVKQLFGYYDNITLNQSQNATFNQAAPLTQDKSWCCCQCWAWYAHAGLAKYLIKNYNFNVSQIVTVMNLEDCCGG